MVNRIIVIEEQFTDIQDIADAGYQSQLLHISTSHGNECNHRVLNAQPNR